MKKVAGESCSVGPKGDDDHECDDDLFCAGKPGGHGTCTALTPPGGACDDMWSSRCVRGAYCTSGGTCALPPANSCVLKPCADGFFCHAYSTCAPATLPLGAPCDIVDGKFVDNDCMPGTVCGLVASSDGGGGQKNTSACVPLPGAGEVCIRDRCAEGLFCAEQTTDSTGVVPKRCEPLRAEGEACSTDYVFHIDCGAGLECRKGTCAPACR
jgi:hypothetical protein